MPAARLITLADAADRCAVSSRTVRNWISAGRLTAYRLGPRVLRIDAAELERLAQPIPTAGISEAS